MAKLRVSCPVLVQHLFSGARPAAQIVDASIEPDCNLVIFTLVGPDVPDCEFVDIVYHVDRGDGIDANKQISVSLRPIDG